MQSRALFVSQRFRRTGPHSPSAKLLLSDVQLARFRSLALRPEQCRCEWWRGQKKRESNQESVHCCRYSWEPYTYLSMRKASLSRDDEVLGNTESILYPEVLHEVLICLRHRWARVRSKAIGSTGACFATRRFSAHGADKFFFASVPSEGDIWDWKKNTDARTELKEKTSHAGLPRSTSKEYS